MAVAIARRWRAYSSFVRTEFEDVAPSNLWRLRGLLRGHQSQALIMLEDQAFLRSEYTPLSLYTRRLATYNNRIDRFLFNKLNQKAWLDHVMPSAAPPMTHYIAGQQLVDLAKPEERLEFEEILSLAQQKGELFLKPAAGGYAKGALRLAHGPDGLQVNGHRVQAREWLDGFLRQKPDAYTISEIIRQGTWSEAFFPPTLNTLRVLTGTHFSSHGTVILAATMKMGRPETYPTDNWKIGRGGISARVDPLNGVLGPGLSYDSKNRRRQVSERHPDSGVQIRNAVIPNWDIVKSRMLRLASQLPYPGLIGWDVALTNDDIVIVEANTTPGLAIHESHASLRRTPEQRAFWAEMGIGDKPGSI
ncbi:sugar-transfer associated ATP-grasp domain-containing protein [Mesorhizobium comanense]|uniref:sugar-transfer associated ATP-grasp domain-containing protein n=1 Tax=Mesorhizobium comanense TaxID=2502215 RepID=UPI001E5555C7|nr:sugar-transfer associated ATP-grasp domain-containing protein [Mesorhizobium comanense]